MSANDLGFDSFLVMPNPFQNYISLESEVNGTVEIYDAFGKQVFIKENFSGKRIDTTEFLAGFYFLRVISDDVNFTRKMVKQ